ncbi:MAG: hypothetical protein QXU32_04735 [Nitrososphaerales archaeon]
MAQNYRRLVIGWRGCSMSSPPTIGLAGFRYASYDSLNSLKAVPHDRGSPQVSNALLENKHIVRR